MLTTLLVDYALVGEDLEVLENASIEIVDGVVSSIGKSWSPGRNPVRIRGVAMPVLVNAHVHLLDYAFAEFGDEAPYTISQLVREPDGLKFRLISSLTTDDVYRVARRIFSKMLHYGVGVVITYVEKPMIAEVRRAVEPGMVTVILGGLVGGEVFSKLHSVLQASDGVGLDSPLRFTVEELEFIKTECRRRGKLVSTHIAETKSIYERGDFKTAFAHLDPDLIVHGTHLGDEELEYVARSGVSIVVCPRSNMWFSVGLPPVSKMVEKGVNVLIGTDNAGIIEPDVWRELEEVYRLLRMQGGPKPDFAREALKMATVNVSKLRGIGEGVRNVIEEGAPARILVISPEEILDSSPRNIYATIAKRGSATSIRLVVLGERIVETWKGL